MEVTLKKASVYAEKLLAAAAALKGTNSLSISIRDTRDASTLFAREREAWINDIEATLVMEEAAYQLRGLIGSLNAETGVDALLTQVARINRQISTLNSVLVVDDYSAIDPEETDLDEYVRSTRETMTAESLRYGGDKITVPFLSRGSGHYQTLFERLQGLKRDKDDLSDQITALNFSTRLRVPDPVVDALRTAGIIA